jgi:ATP-dependent DNA helicase PIF1
MISGRFFETLEFVARTVRQNQLPFGGIQLILCGDFHQLPPVDQIGGFAFESAAWRSCVSLHLLLPGNFRHRDCSFSALLSRVRVGRCTPADLAWLAAAADDDDANRPSNRASDAEDSEGGGAVQATVLYAANRNVDSVNAAELDRLPGPALRFRAVDEGLEEALRVR